MKVIQKVQSINAFQPPADVTFYSGDSLPEALAALVTASATPNESEWYTILEVRIEF